MPIQKATISFRRIYEVEIKSSDLPDPVSHEDVLDHLKKLARMKFESEFEMLSGSSDDFSAHIVDKDITL